MNLVENSPAEKPENDQMPPVFIKDLLEKSCHIGHKTRSWNPKVSNYIYGSQNGMHIIDVSKTISLLKAAMHHVSKIVSEYKKILFVGTKDQVLDIVEENALRCGQYYVNNRWLGGTLTNWTTIFLSIRKMRKIKKMIDGEETKEIESYTKKEKLKLAKLYEKMNKNLKGIEKMNGLPNLMVVFDVNKDKIAVQEANKMGIPVIGIIDSNSNPVGVRFPIPGNDDAIRSVNYFAQCLSDAAIVGMKAAVASSAKKKPTVKEKGEPSKAKFDVKRKSDPKKRFDRKTSDKKPVDAKKPEIKNEK